MSIIEGNHFIYTVRQGDTLYDIARRLGSNVEMITRANALYPPFTDVGLIFPGEVLIVPLTTASPQPNRVYQIVSPGDTLTQYVTRYSTSLDLLTGINPAIQDPNLINVNSVVLVPAFIYEVEPNDTIFKLSRRFGLSMNSIIEANRGRTGFSPDLIYQGYRLIIPLPTSRNIVVFHPMPGTTISNREFLEGYARVFEGVALYRVVDDNGQVVAKETAIQTTAGAPSYGYFGTQIRFDRTPSTRTGELWVYSRSPRDGSIQDLVQIRIMFS
ncbi:LysM peptidoglycan-binding domain-containing protein [Pseudalkalibacillus caeni]|uniref:LysM peptidoglycan-binding domain-containing protein n=1 Tax=Exobacillus caeni TaxID=2574798 RepID=A0A5R9F018_9BACL|nr:LysM peptidoglycan-binding domain-containing protein [Pseudalkalibacillus caeni]TLS36942.1 LysM peptidoglycan-binding domain-containing protein [Pseudalkalibacillus caeni]